MATFPQGTGSPTRTLKLLIRDQHGAPLKGANIIFRVAGDEVGAVKRADSEVSIRLDAGLDVEVGAVFMRQLQTLTIDATTTLQLIVFQQSRVPLSLGSPVARCANGKTGSPCVDCPAGASTVQICA